MKRRLIIALALAMSGGGSAAAAGPAHHGTTLCVGGKPHCFSTIQAAVDAAHDGDTVRISPGTFAGGITIDVSVDVRGAGAGATVISGGGPVVTIGEELADTEPTVSLSGLTITGGLNDSFPDSAVTQGGGIGIPQGSFTTRNGVGATVTIRDSVITRNRVASRQFLPPGFCGPFDCSFADGGGIYNDGTLTLVGTRVSDNQAGDPASITVVANGGGIAGGHRAVLRLEHSSVTGNRTVGAPPRGDVARAAGIDSPGKLEIEDSSVSGNSARLTTDDPIDEFPLAVAGGIGIGSEATIARTRVSHNSVSAVNVGGRTLAFAGGILDEGSLTLVDSTVSHNHVDSSVPASSSDAAFAGAGGMEVQVVATIRHSRFVGNSVTASAPSGFAGAVGGAISNFGETTLERTLVAGNSVRADGADGFAHGGGIANDTLFGPTPSLTLTDSMVTGNAVSSSSGLPLQGGGLFTAFPVTLTRTTIAGNRPDQCFGC